MTFARPLLSWYRQAGRKLPWRATRDPYRIWLSEIMLQQTRVEAVLPYYDAFLRRFPDVATLASAGESDVLALWSGLGYYSRARNMQRAARDIASKGVFPADYAALRALPGIGDYTAAAIASIAFDLPHAAVDGNVLRVVSRIFNDAADIGSPATRRRFQKLAQDAMDARHPGDFNQAMMELGATLCLPRNPRCPACPVRLMCAAHAAGRTAELPVKLKRHQPRRETIRVVIVARGNRVLMHRRPSDASRMPGFWELPQKDDLQGLRQPLYHATFRHTIVHTLFEVQVFTGTLDRAPSGARWINPADESIPVTTITRKALKCTSLRAATDRGGTAL